MSKRKYRIVSVSHLGVEAEIMTIEGLLFSDSFNDSEMVYAAQDVVDAILDLQVEESMIFQSNRDNANYKGVIVRIE